MFLFDDLDKVREVVAHLTSENENKSGKNGRGNQAKKDKDKERNGNKNESCINLDPSELLVIAGFLSGVLEVTSVLVDKDQEVQIVLSGSLKRETQLDQVMKQIGKMPFDQVVKSMIEGSM